MKKNPVSLLFVVAALITANLCADQATQAKQPAAAAQVSAKVEAHSATAVKTDAKQVAAATDQSMAGSCDALPADQQSFAAQLSSSNKMMFCSQFTPDQRKSAMQMMGTMTNGSKMTADQAVEQVASGKMMNSMPAQQKSSGGCPVR